MGRGTDPEQQRHDERVREEAERYKQTGWIVKADIKGYDRPDAIGSKNPRRPDIVAAKPGTTHIIEVATRKDADLKKRETFRRSAGQRNRVIYREIFTDD